MVAYISSSILLLKYPFSTSKTFIVRFYWILMSSQILHSNQFYRNFSPVNVLPSGLVTIETNLDHQDSFLQCVSLLDSSTNIPDLFYPDFSLMNVSHYGSQIESSKWLYQDFFRESVSHQNSLTKFQFILSRYSSSKFVACGLPDNLIQSIFDERRSDAVR